MEPLAAAIHEAPPLPFPYNETPLHDVQEPQTTTRGQHHPLSGGPVTGLAAPRPGSVGSTALLSPEAHSLQPPTHPLGSVASSPSPSTKTANRASCPHCEKTFSRDADMERHAKKHSPAAKTFHCFVDGCKYNGEKGFYRRDKLMAHQRVKHGL